MSVAVDVDGQAHALRSVRTAAGALTWANLERGSCVALAAVGAFNAFHARGVRLFRGQALSSARQLAQLVVHRASILTLAGGHNAAEIEKQAIEEVLTAASGHSIAFSLEQLPRLGLDIGYSRQRHALQLVINLAEANGLAQLLDDLVIEPCAQSGVQHARNWLRDYATPQMLNDMSEFASVDGLARQLITFQRQHCECPQINEAFHG
ncbi:hypothetical protein [Pseudomonas sp. UMAB-40]|uniref:hypothetical protein n=1 Tax=Pseudomonas sp. UMAB-40 TaxID=1365407 RepID=UPI001C570D60|nr:hypothetical protein [Pseudomonas sp. UMAB-40]